MPDYFSHGVTAEVIYERLESKYKNMLSPKPLYMLGAQGGDLFFAYSIKPAQSNLGRVLHRKKAVYLFERLSEGNLAYTAGYAAHYALDSVLHPAVYKYEDTQRSPFAHSKFENDLGLFISRKYSLRRQIIPRKNLLSCTSAVYDTIKLVEPSVTVTGVERCLKRHFTWTKYYFRVKRQEYKCNFDFNTLSDKVEEAVDFGLTAVRCVLDGNIDPEIFSREFLQK